MAYSLLSDGKRMRPLLVYATANSLQLELAVADHLAAALEMIHAYSLIHDDLPAMDNDDLRRGQATNHIAFDEATAILAGDALQSLAFASLAAAPAEPIVVVKWVRELAQASGLAGMAGGQSLDLISEQQTVDLSQLQQIHNAKTGALLRACVAMPVLGHPTLPQDQQQHFLRFAEHLGLAFQVVDDVLDVTQDTATLGKPAHSDTKNNKSTYPSLLGTAGAQQKANELIEAAFDALDQLPQDTDELRDLAHTILHRKH